MIKLPIKVGNALEALQTTGAVKADLIRIANGRYYGDGEVVRKLADIIGDYCRESDENLENVIGAIVGEYQIIQFDDYAKRFSNLAELVLKINFETEYAAFIDYSGHVGTVDIHVSKGKENPDYKERIYERATLWMDDLFTPKYDEVMQELKNLLSVKTDDTGI